MQNLQRTGEDEEKVEQDGMKEMIVVRYSAILQTINLIVLSMEFHWRCQMEKWRLAENTLLL